jgi:hypothetical protein
MDDRLTRIENSARTRPYIRAIIARARADGGGNALAIATSLYPQDRATHALLTRGAVTPTATTTSGVSVATALADFLPLLGPSSACGGVFSRAIKLNLGQAATLAIPEIDVSATGIAFLGQGDPFPFKELSFATNNKAISNKKLGFGIVLTRELWEYSNAEAVISRVLAENLTLGLDSILFDDVVADTTRPAGLRYNVNATAATSGGGNEALLGDLGKLVGAIAPVAGTNICFIASPIQYAKIILRRTMAIPFPVLCSAALADGVVVAVALNALVVVGDETPKFDLSGTATLAMTDPGLPVSTAGTAAYPLRSTFQTDTLSLRVIQNINWTLRGSGAVAWTESVTW